MELFEIFQSTKNPSTGSASRIHQHAAPKMGLRFQNSSTNLGVRLQNSSTCSLKRGVRLQKSSTNKGSTSRIHQPTWGSASRFHQLKKIWGVRLQNSSTKKLLGSSSRFIRSGKLTSLPVMATAGFFSGYADLVQLLVYSFPKQFSWCQQYWLIFSSSLTIMHLAKKVFLKNRSYRKQQGDFKLKLCLPRVGCFCNQNSNQRH